MQLQIQAATSVMPVLRAVAKNGSFGLTPCAPMIDARQAPLDALQWPLRHT